MKRSMFLVFKTLFRLQFFLQTGLLLVTVDPAKLLLLAVNLDKLAIMDFLLKLEITFFSEISEETKNNKKHQNKKISPVVFLIQMDYY